MLSGFGGGRLLLQVDVTVILSKHRSFRRRGPCAFELVVVAHGGLLIGHGGQTEIPGVLPEDPLLVEGRLARRVLVLLRLLSLTFESRFAGGCRGRGGTFSLSASSARRCRELDGLVADRPWEASFSLSASTERSVGLAHLVAVLVAGEGGLVSRPGLDNDLMQDRSFVQRHGGHRVLDEDFKWQFHCRDAVEAREGGGGSTFSLSASSAAGGWPTRPLGFSLSASTQVQGGQLLLPGLDVLLPRADPDAGRAVVDPILHEPRDGVVLGGQPLLVRGLGRHAEEHRGLQGHLEVFDHVPGEGAGVPDTLEVVVAWNQPLGFLAGFDRQLPMQCWLWSEPGRDRVEADVADIQVLRHEQVLLRHWCLRCIFALLALVDFMPQLLCGVGQHSQDDSEARGAI